MTTRPALLPPTHRLDLYHPDASREFTHYISWTVFKDRFVHYPVYVYSSRTSEMAHRLLRDKAVCVPQSSEVPKNLPTFIGNALAFSDPNYTLTDIKLIEPEGSAPHLTFFLNTSLGFTDIFDITQTAIEFLNWHPDYHRIVKYECVVEKPSDMDKYRLTIVPRRVISAQSLEYYEKYIGKYVDPETIPEIVNRRFLNLDPLPERDNIEPELIVQFVTPVIRDFDKDATVEPLILNRLIPGCVLIRSAIPCLSSGDILGRAFKKTGFGATFSSCIGCPCAPLQNLIFLTVKPLRSRSNPYDPVLAFQKEISLYVEGKRAHFLEKGTGDQVILEMLLDVFRSFNPDTNLELLATSKAYSPNLKMTTPLSSFALIRTLDATLNAALLSERTPGGFRYKLDALEPIEGKNVFQLTLNRVEAIREGLTTLDKRAMVEINDKFRRWFMLNEKKLKQAGRKGIHPLVHLLPLVQVYDERASLSPFYVPIENAPTAFSICTSLPLESLDHILSEGYSLIQGQGTDATCEDINISPVDLPLGDQNEYLILCQTSPTQTPLCSYQGILQQVRAQTLDLIRSKPLLIPHFIIEPTSGFLFAENLLKAFDPSLKVLDVRAKDTLPNSRKFETQIPPLLVLQIVRTGLKSQFLDLDFPKGYDCQIYSTRFNEETGRHTIELTLAQKDGSLTDTIAQLNLIRAFHIQHAHKVPSTLNAKNVAEYFKDVFSELKLDVGVREDFTNDTSDIQLYLSSRIPFAELRAMIAILHRTLLASCVEFEKHQEYTLEFRGTQRFKKFYNLFPEDPEDVGAPHQKRPAPTEDDLYEKETFNVYFLTIAGGSHDYDRVSDDYVVLNGDFDDDEEYVRIDLQQAVHEDMPETLQRNLLGGAVEMAGAALGFLQRMISAGPDEEDT